MGCTPSKQSVCRNCNAQCSPVRRSYSSHSRHSPPPQAANHHAVALTSTTIGYLLLDSSTKPNQLCIEPVRRNAPEKNINEFDEKISKIVPETPVTTPPGEPETINTWELMEGLDDHDPIPLINPPLDNFEPKTVNIKPIKEKLVLYFTSLRGVRKTYEDCCHVRVILKNCGVRVDERDVSMHSGFKDELKELLGDRCGGLPKVFVGRKYIGGVEEIRRFHDELKLDKVLEGCEMEIDGGGGGCDGSCEVCGDIRFIPCETCSGSCKIYYEVKSEEDEDKEEKDDVKEEESDYGFQRCPDCNENGLIRCPICCD